jgi:hypothetical protein
VPVWRYQCNIPIALPSDRFHPSIGSRHANSSHSCPGRQRGATDTRTDDICGAAATTTSAACSGTSDDSPAGATCLLNCQITRIFTKLGRYIQTWRCITRNSCHSHYNRNSLRPIPRRFRRDLQALRPLIPGYTTGKAQSGARIQRQRLSRKQPLRRRRHLPPLLAILWKRRNTIPQTLPCRLTKTHLHPHVMLPRLHPGMCPRKMHDRYDVSCPRPCPRNTNSHRLLYTAGIYQSQRSLWTLYLCFPAEPTVCAAQTVPLPGQDGTISLAKKRTRKWFAWNLLVRKAHSVLFLATNLIILCPMGSAARKTVG